MKRLLRILIFLLWLPLAVNADPLGGKEQIKSADHRLDLTTGTTPGHTDSLKHIDRDSSLDTHPASLKNSPVPRTKGIFRLEPMQKPHVHYGTVSPTYRFKVAAPAEKGIYRVIPASKH